MGEAYTPEIGWAIDAGELADEAEQDAADGPSSTACSRTRSSRPTPTAPLADRGGWVDRGRRQSGFGAERMVREYTEGTTCRRTTKVTLLPVAGPYSFELSTERFRRLRA